MSQYTVLFNANVLYPAPMRDALMQLVVTDLFKAKWTADIHREWIDALLHNKFMLGLDLGYVVFRRTGRAGTGNPIRYPGQTRDGFQLSHRVHLKCDPDLRR